MSIDRPARRADYRPTAVIDTSEPLTVLLEHFAKQWPQYQPVVHRKSGYYGVVRNDTPANFLYRFDGKPGRICIAPGGETWVSVVWEPASTFPVRAWVPASLLKTVPRRY
ncbi:hypothetical protein [Streptomyces beihaiensis]|uniref:Uncharacterized protein n=1 Tax=Streptomyces beihaiensis TaxID=2984495 RepID=A0ABT3TRE3_9ACTN|nr:hypothetical protein [Streptomyces beihaiensis]MCX3059609.1 hypothetical protein [Streptomyces beihaiensis]